MLAIEGPFFKISWNAIYGLPAHEVGHQHHHHQASYTTKQHISSFKTLQYNYSTHQT